MNTEKENLKKEIMDLKDKVEALRREADVINKEILKKRNLLWEMLTVEDLDVEWNARLMNVLKNNLGMGPKDSLSKLKPLSKEHLLRFKNAGPKTINYLFEVLYYWGLH